MNAEICAAVAGLQTVSNIFRLAIRTIDKMHLHLFQNAKCCKIIVLIQAFDQSLQINKKSHVNLLKLD